MASLNYWLNEQRLRVYPRIFLAIYGSIILYWITNQFWLVEEPITALRNDFAGFWSVGHMVLEGRASEAYIPDEAYAAQATYVPGHVVHLPWFYPPQFFFVVGPLAGLPYFAAFFLWTLGSLSCLALALRALAPHPSTIWILLASPGLFWTLRWGQSGILAAALLGGAIYCLAHRNHLRTGILIGLLAFKPQFGLLIPFALIAGRQWRVFAVATATTIVIVGISSLFFGVEVWPNFFEAMSLSMAMQFDGTLPHSQMVSLSALLSTIGLSYEVARAWQILQSFTVLVVVLHVWLRLGPCLLSGAILAAGSVLATPHILGYDLVLFAPSIAILAWDGYQRGWLWGERIIYLLLWIWPWVSDAVANVTDISIGVVGSFLLFTLAFRRCRVIGNVLLTKDSR
jgi:hypothetical protein